MAGEYNPTPVGNPSLLKRRSWAETQLVKFIGRHTPKCREVVRILSQSLDGPLPLRTRIELLEGQLAWLMDHRPAAEAALLRPGQSLRWLRGMADWSAQSDALRHNLAVAGG